MIPLSKWLVKGQICLYNKQYLILTASLVVSQSFDGELTIKVSRHCQTLSNYVCGTRSTSKWDNCTFIIAEALLPCEHLLDLL